MAHFVREYKVVQITRDSCFLTATLSSSCLYIAIDLIEPSVLLLSISATDLRAATPFLSATRTALRYLTPVHVILGGLLRSFASVVPSERSGLLGVRTCEKV
jgi:hypothetical protein